MTENKNKAVFLDRDGVINDNRGHHYITDPGELIFNRGIFEALNRLQGAGYLLIIISNQGCVSRGICTPRDVEYLHREMLQILSSRGIQITEIYYCPHHPDHESCLCRKPSGLMIEKALARFRIDPSSSVMIGDRPGDIQAARSAGVPGILMESNTDLRPLISQFLKEKDTP